MHHIFSDPTWILECFWTYTFNLQVLMSVPSITWCRMEKTSFWLHTLFVSFYQTPFYYDKSIAPKIFCTILYFSVLLSGLPNFIYFFSHSDKAFLFFLVSHHVWCFLFSFFFESTSWVVSFKTRLSIITEVSPDVGKA